MESMEQLIVMHKCSLPMICLLLLFSPTVAQQNQRNGSTKTEAELTYQPPLVPIELSVNSNGEAAIKLAPKCVTPLGTFGAGKGVSAVSTDNNTYIVFRTPATKKGTLSNQKGDIVL